MKDMRNPFQYGAELKPSQIVDRKQELRDVQRAILEHRRLLGPRRFGKTVILRAATAAAERDGAVISRLNAEAYPCVDGLVRAIVTESAQKLKSDVAKTGEKILRFFSITSSGQHRGNIHSWELNKSEPHLTLDKIYYQDRI